MSSRRTTLRSAVMERIADSSMTKDEIVAALEHDSDEIAEVRVERRAIVEIIVRQLDGNGYRDVRRMALYDLRDVDRVDVIRIGRQPGQDIQVLDMIVSREHGLVLYDGHTFYHDYGTLLVEPTDGRPPGRSGSRNGSFLNGTVLIRNGLVPWPQGDTIHFGTLRDGHFAAQLAYEYVLRPNEN